MLEKQYKACELLLSRYRRIKYILETNYLENCSNSFGTSSSTYSAFKNLPVSQQEFKSIINEYVEIMEKALQRYKARINYKDNKNIKPKLKKYYTIINLAYYDTNERPMKEIEKIAGVSLNNISKEHKNALDDFIPCLISVMKKYGYTTHYNQRVKNTLKELLKYEQKKTN